MTRIRRSARGRLAAITAAGTLVLIPVLAMPVGTYAAGDHPGGSCGGGHDEGSHEDGGHDSGGGGMRGGGRGSPRHAGGGGPSGHLEDRVLHGHEDHAGGGHDPTRLDRGRPPWAGSGHGDDALDSDHGGGDDGHDAHAAGAAPASAVTSWAVARDADGVPVLDANGHVRPVLETGRIANLTATGRLPGDCIGRVSRVTLAPFGEALASTPVLRAEFETVLATAGTPPRQQQPAPATRRVSLVLYTHAMVADGVGRDEAARFLAGAASDPVTVDQVVLLNDVLGINAVSPEGHAAFADFTYRASDAPAETSATGIEAFVRLVNAHRRARAVPD